MQALAIAVGGATGSLLRFWLSSGIYALAGRGFPWGTLAVNLLGSFLIGFLSVFMLERMSVGPEVRAGIMIGLLGGFTTFSTFSMETLNLIEQGDLLKAMFNIVVSVVVCVAAAWLGLSLARQQIL